MFAFVNTVTFNAVIFFGTCIIVHGISMDINSRIVYTSRDLFKLRSGSHSPGHAVLSTIKILGLLHYRGSRAGARRTNCIPVIVGQGRDAGCRQDTRMYTSESLMINTGPNTSTTNNVKHNDNIYVLKDRPLERQHALLHDCQQSSDYFRRTPSLYVLNPTSIAKPYALQQLHADLLANSSDVAVISESWFKRQHTNQMADLPGYNVFRCDRRKR